MKTLAEIEALLKPHVPALKARYGLTEIALFGSYVRGEQTPASDLDVLIDYERPPSLFSLVKLGLDVERLTGLKADIVPKPCLKPFSGPNIRREAKPI